MTPNADYRSAVRLGIGVLVLGFGGFLAWAGLAPLDEAVPAPGVVALEGKRKRVEHLAGGQIRQILVREGEQVRAGQELVLLEEAQSRAGLNAAESQWRVAAATEIRLKAERDTLKAVSFPKDLAVEGRAQAELFRARRAALEGELHILRESVRGLEGQLKSLEELEAGRAKQVHLFQEQLASFRSLREKGFVSRNQILDLERQLAEVQSRESETLANLAGVNAKLTELRMRAVQREVEQRREVESQLAEVQKELATLAERVAAHKDSNSRLVIRAPVSGVVVELAFHTVGGVVRPGDRILDLVPEDDDLIVEARVAPQYIDRVRAGLAADVHFDAYLSRVEQPVIRGAVTLVSADALADPRTGSAHYALRVMVPRAELERLGRLQLQPGMQATVMVKTGERTLLAYLARPLLRRFIPALTES